MLPLGSAEGCRPWMGSTALASILQHLQLLLHLAHLGVSRCPSPRPWPGVSVLCVLLFLCSTEYILMTHSVGPPPSQAQGTEMEFVVLGFFLTLNSPCCRGIFAPTTSNRNRSTVRPPPSRAPGGRQDPNPAVRSLRSLICNWVLRLLLPFLGKTRVGAEQLSQLQSGFLAPYPQPPPVEIRRSEKMTSHLACSLFSFEDSFLISEGSVWNSEKSFTLESQALANQMFGFTLSYPMTV